MPVRTDFDRGWLFHRGEITLEQPAYKGAMYMQAKTQRALLGPAAMAYNDSPDSYGTSVELKTDIWENVDLPHDYVITQTPSPEYNSALGYFKYENAWYRKHFRLGAEDRGKRITLYFEGAATRADVWVNGCLMGHSFCGYVPFEIDITDVARYDGENIVAVHIGATEHEGWWYEGAGLYRHVWLVKSADVSVDLYGVYVHPVNNKLGWIVPVETTVRNDSDRRRSVSVKNELLDADGRLIDAEMPNLPPISSLVIEPYTKAAGLSSFRLASPALWDIDNPYLYTVRTSIIEDGETIDTQETAFGIRSAEWKADGFYLNGRRVYLNGVCCHQDYGLTGKAIPDNIHRYRLRLMQSMGANALRTSHYMNSEATLDCCDRIGMLVMDETRWFESTPDGIAQLETLVKRDRSRPSVIMWSLGNEETFHRTEQGVRIMKRMYAAVRRLDDRAITAAVSNDPANAPVNDVMDVIGVNYNRDAYKAIRERYPDKPILSSECCATGTTRGWYLPTDPKRGYISAYDHDNDSKTWFSGRELMRKFIIDNPYICGEFQWAGIEHRGETLWPRLCSCSGAVDLFLLKKDAYYQNKSHWTDLPMVHILPNLELDGREGERITAYVYTNCDEAELFANNESLGRKQIEAGGHYEAEFVYPVNSLIAVGYRKGVECARDEIIKPSAPRSLRLEWLNRDDFTANGRDLALLRCTCTDENGIQVRNASPYVSFYVNGSGVVAGTGSDDTDHNPPQSPDRAMFAGEISAAIKAWGKVRVYAKADNLQTAVIDIEC